MRNLCINLPYKPFSLLFVFGCTLIAASLIISYSRGTQAQAVDTSITSSPNSTTSASNSDQSNSVVFMPLAFDEIDFLNLSTEEQLKIVPIPESDLNDLALRLRPEVDAIPSPPAEAANYEAGTQIDFWVLNLETSVATTITAELLHRTNNAYAWVETNQPHDDSKIIESVNKFSEVIYPTMVGFFGQENSPGVDNDPRLHILHTANTGGGVAGFFSPSDSYSNVVSQFSNEKEMFYISLNWLNSLDDYAEYEHVLAHEFQHMIHFALDHSESNWINEGLSEYAVEYVGLELPTARLNNYAAWPATPLTSWDVNYASRAHYGSAYLFISYLAQRFGTDLIKSIAVEPTHSTESVTLSLQAAGYDETFTSVFGDWVIANYADEPTALGKPDVYGYEQFDFDTPQSIKYKLPITSTSYSKNNFGVDYILLEPQNDNDATDLTLVFNGGKQTRLADTIFPVGKRAWWSNRRNEMDARLTRQFDFTQLAPDTPIELTATMWWDIEEHYDYGYALISEDGVKWQILHSGFTTRKNPTGANFGSGYNERSGKGFGAPKPEWIFERYDLSDYVGKSIWFRFEYITDAGNNHTGWFIDNIQVPAIGYSSDFESSTGGWISEGWLLTDNVLRQGWLVQLFTLQNNRLEAVYHIPVDANGHAEFVIPALGNGRTAVLTVSGTTQVTTEKALYEFSISEN